MISVALFNNKGGVGKTTLTYHLAHMLQRLGHRVLAVDLDPQSNLTAAFLDEEDLEQVWREPNGVTVSPGESGQAPTVAAAVKPIMEGMGDIRPCEPVPIAEGLWLLAGDLTLSSFEDRLSEAWPKGFTGDPAALRTTTAFHRILQTAGREVDADIALIDVGPNLGAINRAALLAADTVLVPLAADLFSLRGLRNLGPTLRMWRRTWHHKVMPDLPPGIEAPVGRMRPLGYVIMQPTMRLDRPVKAYQRWLDRIPEVFATSVLDEPGSGVTRKAYEIATLRNYQSLMPLSHDARKPMFDLRSADGALGSTQTLVQRCYQDFRSLSEKLLQRLDDIRASS
ncbi:MULTISPECIES: ParA family protein [Micromonospora]|uniref:Chromosome partitioning protein n=1 Tax=Micromonospora sicca TaxID=2202420 RepID=A0A317DM24_9ACTN|nr:MULTISPECIES: ParA family protein [unclassified Micromonospora]MBM0225220.1 ParA family protein [Micromonospora sp. ATA51]PWR15839.1 chromosome partitioning protein [Micromonospora sp. 4G51]